MLNIQSTLDWTIADSIDHSRFIQTLYMFGPLFGVKTVITVTVCTGWSHWESRSLTWSAGFFEFLVRFLSATKEVLQNGPSMVGDWSLITDHQSRKANEANAKHTKVAPGQNPHAWWSAHCRNWQLQRNQLPNGSKKNQTALMQRSVQHLKICLPPIWLWHFHSQGKHCDDWTPLQPLKEAPVKKMALAELPQGYESNFYHIERIPYNHTVTKCCKTRAHTQTLKKCCKRKTSLVFLKLTQMFILAVGPRWPPECTIQEGKREWKVSVV